VKLKYSQLLIETGKPGKGTWDYTNHPEAESANYEFFLHGVSPEPHRQTQRGTGGFEQAVALCLETVKGCLQHFPILHAGFKSETGLRYLLLAYEQNAENLLVLYDLPLNYEKLEEIDLAIESYNRYLELDPLPSMYGTTWECFIPLSRNSTVPWRLMISPLR